ncbi:trimeric intracellular cation channel family protein [Ottowia testudinis]|uniref:Trimeric intracellular cation channel family protein n=1 Tax=Ottowia testudinis TaxID=2816950 RepID=A0A975CF18_9BURK|nr:trimeric intracellular cation channel family protein [Ottowia testudinis]QTD44637.1 trimeric intracellular cation channel family protein [Ottowia testudinis]
MDYLQPLSPLWGTRLHMALELAATLAFALSGVIEAARKRLDVVGVAVVAFAAAFGGGTLRDLLLDYRPFFWVAHIEFLWSVVALCAAAMLFMRQQHLHPTERAILWPDAIGLGLFTAIGVDRALAMGQPALVAVMMGVITSVFGGVLRDVLCNEVPRALSDHRPYALWAFAGGWLHCVLLTLAGLPPWLALTLTVVATAGLRLVSVYRDWQLPSWHD